jgi:hypothetical protein
MQNKPNFRAKPGGTRPRGRGTRDNCAKRTQLPEAGHRGGVGGCGRREPPMIPVFHHSSVPTRCRLCKTKPICPAGPGAWAVGCCTNKANFRRSKKKGKGLTGKDLWWIIHPTGLGKTKPIPGHIGRDGAGDAGRGATAQNKPNSGRRPVGRGPGGRRPWACTNKPHSSCRSA